MGSGQWVVTTTCESVLTWNYDVAHQGLRDLYAKSQARAVECFGRRGLEPTGGP